MTGHGALIDVAIDDPDSPVGDDLLSDYPYWEIAVQDHRVSAVCHVCYDVPDEPPADMWPCPAQEAAEHGWIETTLPSHDPRIGEFVVEAETAAYVDPIRM